MPDSNTKSASAADATPSLEGGALPEPHFRIVLHEPEIPNNTGNIGRTCIATGCALDLVHPLGFETNNKALKRAGMDYWPRVRCIEHESWAAYEQRCVKLGRPPKHWFFTTRTTRVMWDVDFSAGDALVFGKESLGLPSDVLEAYPEQLVTMPMMAGERSLNLGNCVCAAIYEGLRQLRAKGQAALNNNARWA